MDISATGPNVDRTPPVTQSSSTNQAVLSLQTKKAYADACMLGLTLTNTLPHKIKDIAFKFTVYLRSSVAYNQVTRNFFDLNPTDRRYREITINGVTCAEIERVEVSDAGRCTMDDLGRFNAKPGDWLKRVEVAYSPHVSFIRKWRRGRAWGPSPSRCGAMRLAIVILSALWGIAAILAFTETSERSLDAKLTAAYILLWPVLGIALLLNEPVPLWLAVPVVFGFIPWIMAGPHLWALVKDPGQTRPDEVIGIPRAYWVWGGLGAILLGIVFG